MLKSPRCECGRYSKNYAAVIGHACPDSPQPPAPRGAKKDLEQTSLVLELRADGLLLAEIAERIGLTVQRVQQIVARSGVKLCRKCKLPVELLGGTRGNICAPCYAVQMLNRPSKQKRRTGYRTSKRAHRRAAALRMAREGKMYGEIAEALGMRYHTVYEILRRMRVAGQDVPVKRGKTGPKPPKESR